MLLSHGDLAHCGLYPWAYSRWGLKAPAYTTLPVQAMGRIAVTEDVEGLRDEEEVIDEPRESHSVDDENVESRDQSLPAKDGKEKFIASVIEVQDAFDSCNTLRYSQPTHLQGKFMYTYLSLLITHVFRKMPGIDHNTIQRRPYSRWYYMENSIPFFWHNYLCCQRKSHARTSFGRHSLDSSSSWGYLRASCTTRSSHY